MSDWRNVYDAVVSETDPVTLTRLIHEFEEAAFKRGMQLAAHPDAEESRAIESALARVLSIKNQRLGWPDPRNTR